MACKARFDFQRARKGENLGGVASVTIVGPKCDDKNFTEISNACEKSLITLACYLCNTRLKTRCSVAFQAVPLLRVHLPSVIVIERRRGASQGRPVLGGSLKSLAFMRVCPKARSG